MKININNLDFEEVDDLPTKQKIKSKPKVLETDEKKKKKRERQ